MTAPTITAPTIDRTIPTRESSEPLNIPQAIVELEPERVAPAGADLTAGAKLVSSPTRPSPRLSDPTLATLADVLDDLERTRTANANRLRTLTRDEPDCDGVLRGFGLTDGHPAVKTLTALVEALESAEHQATLALQRQMRVHPLGPWVKRTRGVGEKQGARLLAAIRDPYWNELHDRPRTVSELWAYCGLHVLPVDHFVSEARDSLVGGGQTSDAHVTDATHSRPGVAARRRRGERANWSTTAKTRAYLVAVSCMKALGSPYRDVYLDRRAHTAITHPEWTPGHSHNDALRITSKAILRDLWIEARAIHTGVTDVDL